ncbi:MAG: DUF2244 domain-containing protein [Sphingomonadaceae bacterium]
MAPDKRAPILNLRIWPHRSMAPRHFRLAVAGVAILFLLMALRFVMLGAWPILPFLLVDVALLAWALRASYRSANAAEHLLLDERELVLVRVNPLGGRQRVRLEPLSVRVELERFPDARNRLWLRSREHRVALGSFLSAAEREALAREVEAGLARWRSGAR